MVETSMQKRQFTAGLLLISLWTLGSAQAQSLSEGAAGLGIRSALERVASAAVASLGRTEGFLGNLKVRIPLPGVLDDAARLLRAIGQQKKVDELMVALNRAAQAARPQANIQCHVTAKSLDGLLPMIGQAERKIRRDLVGTGSASLPWVFSS
jgi:hypothetical protein